MSPKLSPDGTHFQGNTYFIKILTDHGAKWFP